MSVGHSSVPVGSIIGQWGAWAHTAAQTVVNMVRGSSLETTTTAADMGSVKGYRAVSRGAPSVLSPPPQQQLCASAQAAAPISSAQRQGKPWCTAVSRAIPVAPTKILVIPSTLVTNITAASARLGRELEHRPQRVCDVLS